MMFVDRVNSYLNNAVEAYKADKGSGRIGLNINKAMNLVDAYNFNLERYVNQFYSVLVHAEPRKAKMLDAIKTELDNRIPVNLVSVK